MNQPVNIFDTMAQAIVNPVNCVGVMGKGLALAVLKRYPLCLPSYQEACRNGTLRPGTVLAWPTGKTLPSHVIQFPTKRHWSKPSSLDDIKIGLPALVECLRENGIESVAIPALGCGNGGLDWSAVEPVIREYFEVNAPSIKLILLGPQ
jgi:O-acetyl-ADP-ribose deacetylase (regulator of RNase III)